MTTTRFPNDKEPLLRYADGQPRIDAFAPPYRAPQAIKPETRLPEGTVMILRLSSTLPMDLMAPLILRVRREYTAMPLAVTVPGGTVVPGLLAWATEVGRLHVRAVLLEEEPLHSGLRSALSAPADLGGAVAEWLHLHGIAHPAAVPLIAKIGRSSLLEPRVADLAAQVQMKAPSLRSLLIRHHLPSPNRWLALFRALRAALALQRQPDRRLLECALELGFAERASLIHSLRRCFGVPPRAVRERMGWEWLAHRWVTRSACHGGLIGTSQAANPPHSRLNPVRKAAVIPRPPHS